MPSHICFKIMVRSKNGPATCLWQVGTAKILCLAAVDDFTGENLLTGFSVLQHLRTDSRTLQEANGMLVDDIDRAAVRNLTAS